MSRFNEWLEKRTVLDRWQNTGLLGSIEESLQFHAALCLETQRLHNQESELDSKFKRIIIPVIARMFGGLSNSELNLETTMEPQEEWAKIDCWEKDSDQKSLEEEAEMAAQNAECVCNKIKELAEGNDSIKVHCFTQKEGDVYVNYSV